MLDRPEKLNALSARLMDELIAATAWFDAQPAVKVVILSGAGRAFCGGADLGGFQPTPSSEAAADVLRSELDRGRRMVDAVAGMRALTIAALHGHCVGGGVVLASACDIRVAAKGTRFSIPEVDLGIPLTWGGIPRLVRELGPALTKELVLTCRVFDADEAQAIRFVNRVVSEADLRAAALELADKLASQPAYSLIARDHGFLPRVDHQNSPGR